MNVEAEKDGKAESRNSEGNVGGEGVVHLEDGLEGTMETWSLAQ